MNPLKASRLFAGLTSEELEDLSRGVSRQSYASGQVVFAEEEPGDGAYVIQEGMVQISAPLPGGDRRVLARLGPGELFGEMAVLDDAPRSARASAETESILYFIPRQCFLETVERHPRLMGILLREVTRRLRDFNQVHVRELIQTERLALVGRFARSIVHDLRGPLGIISLSAEMATADTATTTSRTAAKDRILRQIDRIANMVNELMDLTRDSHVTIQLSPSDYQALVSQLIHEARSELELHGVKIEIETQPPAVELMLNPQRLLRVFHNFLNNAVEAMQGAGVITFRFLIKDDQVITEVEDSGPGIAEEISAKLFEPFATFGKAGGTGLGLSICKKIIEDHGGRIYSRVEAGRGAIFGFTLPVPCRKESPSTSSLQD